MTEPHAPRWYIRIRSRDGEEICITATGNDPQYPATVATRAHGRAAEAALAEIRMEVLTPPQDMKWELHSADDLYGWHAAVGEVINRRNHEGWSVEHNLP
jgi:hypothetical protein